MGRLILIPLSLFLTACSISGLPGDAIMKDLSDEEVVQACKGQVDFNRNYFSDNEIFQISCNLGGLQQGDAIGGDFDKVICAEVIEKCMEDTKEDPVDDGYEAAIKACEASTAARWVNCDATISEWEACLRESKGNVRKLLLSDFKCSETHLKHYNERTPGEKCEAFNEKCVTQAINE